MSKKRTRRSALALIGSGAGLLTWGTGGFTDVTAERQVNIDKTEDSSDHPFLGINTLDPIGGPGQTVSLIELTNNLDEQSDIRLNDATVNSIDSTEVTDLFKGEGVSATNYFDLPSDLGTTKQTKQGTIEATLDIPPEASTGSDSEYNITFDITATAGSLEVTLNRPVTVTYDDPRVSWWNFNKIDGKDVTDQWGDTDVERAEYTICTDRRGRRGRCTEWEDYYQPEIVPARDNSVLDFEGDSPYYDPDVLTANSTGALDFTGEFSLSVWVKPSGNSLNDLGRLFSKWNSNYEKGYQLFLTENNDIGIETANETGDYIITEVSVPQNEWSHVVWTHGSNNDIVYLNGEQKGQYLDLGDPVGSDEPLRIGNGIDTWGNLAYPFNGRMDEPKAYDIALTEQQAQNLYNTSTNGDSGSIGG